jgi:hypothetical protein
MTVLTGDLVISGMDFMAEKDWPLRPPLKHPANSEFANIKIDHSKDKDQKESKEDFSPVFHVSFFTLIFEMCYMGALR